MSTGEERRLKLVKTTPTADPTTGTASGTGTAAEGRQPAAGGSGARRSTDGVRQGRGGRTAATRRTVTRRIPAGKDPVEAILERLDQEPAAEQSGSTDAPASAEPTTSDDHTTSDEPTAAADEPASITRKRFGVRRTSGTRKTSAAGKRSGRPSGTTVGLAVALCAALALAGFFGYQWQQDRAIDRAHAHALAAARQTTVNFVSVSASSVDSDLQRITAGATGEFKEEFVRGQAQVRAAVLENKVESRGTVLRAGLLSGDRRSAVVLVAVDATVKNVHSPDGRPAHYRIQVDLTRERDSDTWLVSRLQFVG